MKKCFTSTLFLFLFGLLGISAQTTFFSTDFSDGMPEGFVLHDVDGRTPSIDMLNLGFEVGKAWIVNKGVDPDDSTNMVAISTSWYRNAGSANDWMVTTPISITSNKAVLTFRAMARDAEYRDGFKVYVSTTGTETADFTDSPVLSVSKENHTWTSHSVDLSAYNGKTIYIAFVNDSRDKSALYVDDIFVGIPSSISMSLNLPRVFDGFGDIQLSGTVKATADVNKYTIGFESGDQKISQEFNASLQAGDTATFTIAQPFNLPRNTTASYKAYVTANGDTSFVSGKTSAYLWKIVAEEVTGTWCGYCVRGIGAMKYMRENYPNGYIGIAVHNNSAGSNVPDSMAIPGEEYLNAIFADMGQSGYPHAGVIRNNMFWSDPANIPTFYTYIKKNMTNLHKFGLQASATYDASTNKITATTNIFSSANIDASKYRMAYVVIENNVHRTHAETGIMNNYCGYDQINYYSGGSQGSMYGFENMDYVLNADTMYFNDVARDIQPSYDGLGNVLPATLEEDGEYTTSYTFDMPATVLKQENAEVVVLLLNDDGVIVNADNCKIDNVIPSGIAKATAAKAKTDKAYYNIAGQRVENPSHGVYIQNGKKIIVK